MLNLDICLYAKKIQGYIVLAIYSHYDRIDTLWDLLLGH